MTYEYKYLYDFLLKSNELSGLVNLKSLGRGKATRLAKYRLFKKNALILYGNKCGYCGDEMEFESATLDHINPKCRSNEQSQRIPNKILVCYKCNFEKNDMSMLHFLFYKDK